MKALPTLVLAVSLLATPGAALAEGKAASAREELSSKPPAPGERTLYGRIIAPCCWNQTLDVHDSEVTRDLRMEIRGRLYDGETPAAIEESLVARYGERVRAAPTRDPMKNVAGGLLVAVVVAGLGVALVLRRLRGQPAPAPAPEPQPAAGPKVAARDAYDERLDDELRDLD